PEHWSQQQCNDIRSMMERKVAIKLVSTKHVNLISQWIRDQGTGFISQQTKYQTKSMLKQRFNYCALQHQRIGFNNWRDNPFSWSTSNKCSTHMQRSFIFAFGNDYSNPIEIGKHSKLKNYRTTDE
ncbi:12299_t:CDS:2, partial [Acaulospora morrowiae]